MTIIMDGQKIKADISTLEKGQKIDSKNFKRDTRAIVEHRTNNQELHLFMYAGKGQVRYVDQMIYIDYHQEKKQYYKFDDNRIKIIFELIPSRAYVLFELENCLNEMKELTNFIDGINQSGINSKNFATFLPGRNLLGPNMEFGINVWKDLIWYLCDRPIFGLFNSVERLYLFNKSTIEHLIEFYIGELPKNLREHELLEPILETAPNMAWGDVRDENPLIESHPMVAYLLYVHYYLRKAYLCYRGGISRNSVFNDGYSALGFLRSVESLKEYIDKFFNEASVYMSRRKNEMSLENIRLS